MRCAAWAASLARPLGGRSWYEAIFSAEERGRTVVEAAILLFVCGTASDVRVVRCAEDGGGCLAVNIERTPALGESYYGIQCSAENI